MRTPGYRPESSLSIKSKIKDQTFAPVKAFADLTDEEKAARRAADQAKYAKIKEDLFLTTAGMAGSGAVAAFAVGGTNMGYSWLLARRAPSPTCVFSAARRNRPTSKAVHRPS